MILKRQEKNNLIKAIYESSNIAASTYNSETEDLILIFKSGTQYRYPKVSKSDYMRFEIAESQGKVFNSHIKKYTYEKLDNFEVSQLLNEIEKLSNQEKIAEIEVKRAELLKKLTYTINITEKERTEETDKIFIDNLQELKKSIDIFLAEM
jgi:hypothetical protein